MLGFLVFDQRILDNDLVSIQFANYKIHFSQFYPLYQKEIAIYDRLGLEAFWKYSDFALNDVSPQPIRD